MSAWNVKAATVQAATVWPTGKYQLNHSAEMPPQPGSDRRLLEAGSIVFYDGRPAPHMEPLDEQAAANVKHVIDTFGVPVVDPTSSLSLIMGEVDSAGNTIGELEAKIAALKAEQSGARARGAPGAVPPAPALAPAVAGRPVGDNTYGIPQAPPLASRQAA